MYNILVNVDRYRYFDHDTGDSFHKALYVYLIK